MTPQLVSALMPALRRVDAERAHELAVLALRLGLAGRDASVDDPALGMQVLGWTLRNPVGLAAGFDKNATALRALRRLGFGVLEAGTVTPRAQPGNPRPRVFRLVEDGAVINRYGMNGHGLQPFAARLAALKRRGPRAVPIGANVGLNKEGSDPERDYPALVASVAPYADYIVINVSSPNTPGLRDLQAAARLGAILQAVREGSPRRPPLLVKVAPDLDEDGLLAVVETAAAHGIEGLIISNTTTARPAGLRGRHAGETGGLSGAPLFGPSTAMLARAYRQAAGRLVLFGCGGVATGADVLAKIRAGAHVVQLYTAFSYAGPALVPRLKAELARALREQGFRSAQQAVGVDA